MPRYTPEVAKAKAEKLIKSYNRNGLNQSALARELGVTSEAINQRLKKKPVLDTLQAYINSPKLKNRLIKVAQDALSAYHEKRVKNKDGEIKLKKIPDHDTRHKYWHDLVTAGGVLKPSDSGGIKIINIVHAYRKEKNAADT